MIKFFRNIRKSLLSEGKTNKYLKYAIGEIILVVVGILIAINLNNTNQNNISKKERNEKITRLRHLVHNDSIALVYSINFNKENIKKIDSLISYLSPEMSLDNYKQFTHLFARANMEFRTTLPDLSIYTELINSGEFSKIDNSKLKSNITDYYILYNHFNNIIHRFVDALYLTEKKLFYEGILSHKYFQSNLTEEEIAEGYKEFLQQIGNSTNRRILENHFYELKDMHQQIIFFYNVIINSMQNLSLAPENND